MLTETQLQELLEAAKPSIVESLRNDIKSQITWQVKEVAGAQIRDHVQAWVKDNIIPEITSMLVESKEGLIAVGVKLAPQVLDLLIASLVESIAKGLSESWTRKKILEAMFNS